MNNNTSSTPKNATKPLSSNSPKTRTNRHSYPHPNKHTHTHTHSHPHYHPKPRVNQYSPNRHPHRSHHNYDHTRNRNKSPKHRPNARLNLSKTNKNLNANTSTPNQSNSMHHPLPNQYNPLYPSANPSTLYPIPYQPNLNIMPYPMQNMPIYPANNPAIMYSHQLMLQRQQNAFYQSKNKAKPVPNPTQTQTQNPTPPQTQNAAKPSLQSMIKGTIKMEPNPNTNIATATEKNTDNKVKFSFNKTVNKSDKLQGNIMRPQRRDFSSEDEEINHESTSYTSSSSYSGTASSFGGRSRSNSMDRNKRRYYKYNRRDSRRDRYRYNRRERRDRYHRRNSHGHHSRTHAHNRREGREGRDVRERRGGSVATNVCKDDGLEKVISDVMDKSTLSDPSPTYPYNVTKPDEPVKAIHPVKQIKQILREKNEKCNEGMHVCALTPTPPTPLTAQVEKHNISGGMGVSSGHSVSNKKYSSPGKSDMTHRTKNERHRRDDREKERERDRNRERNRGRNRDYEGYRRRDRRQDRDRNRSRGRDSRRHFRYKYSNKSTVNARDRERNGNGNNYRDRRRKRRNRGRSPSISSSMPRKNNNSNNRSAKSMNHNKNNNNLPEKQRMGKIKNVAEAVKEKKNVESNKKKTKVDSGNGGVEVRVKEKRNIVSLEAMKHPLMIQYLETNHEKGSNETGSGENVMIQEKVQNAVSNIHKKNNHANSESVNDEKSKIRNLKVENSGNLTTIQAVYNKITQHHQLSSQIHADDNEMDAESSISSSNSSDYYKRYSHSSSVNRKKKSKNENKSDCKKTKNKNKSKKKGDRASRRRRYSISCSRSLSRSRSRSRTRSDDSYSNSQSHSHSRSRSRSRSDDSYSHSNSNSNSFSSNSHSERLRSRPRKKLHKNVKNAKNEKKVLAPPPIGVRVEVAPNRISTNNKIIQTHFVNKMNLQSIFHPLVIDDQCSSIPVSSSSNKCHAMIQTASSVLGVLGRQKPPKLAKNGNLAKFLRGNGEDYKVMNAIWKKVNECFKSYKMKESDVMRCKVIRQRIFILLCREYLRIRSHPLRECDISIEEFLEYGHKHMIFDKICKIKMKNFKLFQDNIKLQIMRKYNEKISEYKKSKAVKKQTKPKYHYVYEPPKH